MGKCIVTYSLCCDKYLNQVCRYSSVGTVVDYVMSTQSPDRTRMSTLLRHKTGHHSQTSENSYCQHRRSPSINSIGKSNWIVSIDSDYTQGFIVFHSDSLVDWTLLMVSLEQDLISLSILFSCVVLIM